MIDGEGVAAAAAGAAVRCFFRSWSGLCRRWGVVVRGEGVAGVLRLTDCNRFARCCWCCWCRCCCRCWRLRGRLLSWSWLGCCCLLLGRGRWRQSASEHGGSSRHPALLDRTLLLLLFLCLLLVATHFLLLLRLGWCPASLPRWRLLVLVVVVEGGGGVLGLSTLRLLLGCGRLLLALVGRGGSGRRLVQHDVVVVLSEGIAAARAPRQHPSRRCQRRRG